MQSIGERLEEARKRKGISIREAAEATKIRGDYLHKFESNEFDLRLPEIYVRGFLRNYAVYLKLDADKIIADYAAVAANETRGQRSSNREIYGRMDLPPGSSKPSSSSSSSSPQTESRPASSTPQTAAPSPSPSPLSGLDRATLIKTASLAAAGLLLLLFLIWGLGFAFRGASSASVTPPPPISDILNEVILVTTAPARLDVTHQGTGEVLYRSTTAETTGFRLPVPNVPLTIRSNAMESIKLEFRGRTYETGQTGSSGINIDFSREP